MLDESSLIWMAIRQRRSKLRRQFELANSSSRREAFSASMKQFEELMMAATNVGHASRPILLYYALAQAGLAISATHAGNPWSRSRHGLKVPDAAPDIADICVLPESDGTFQVVAKATESNEITQATRLGALWASLPDLNQVPLSPESSDPTALDLLAGRSLDNTWTTTDIDEGRYPHDLSAIICVNGEPPSKEDATVVLNEVIRYYPTAHGCAPIEETYEKISNNRWCMEVFWPGSGNNNPGSRDDKTKAFLRDIGPEYRYKGDYYLRPSVDSTNPQQQPPSPLMTWWCILFSLSILARYQPRKWSDVLNVERSESAIALEYALEIAIKTIPHLVTEALDKEPLLLFKPMTF